MSVGNPLLVVIPSVPTRDFILEKGLMCVLNVGNPFSIKLPLVNT